MKYLKTTKPVTCYLASGWFNEAQEQARQDILKVLEDNEISYFSPKDEVLLSFNSTSEERKAAFDADTQIIKHCDFLIASTVGKDMGTLMEMGMSYAWETPYIVCLCLCCYNSCCGKTHNHAREKHSSYKNKC